MRYFVMLVLLFALETPLAPLGAQSDDAELRNIAWSPDGTRVSGVFDDYTVAVWAVDALDEPLLTFQPELAQVATWTADSEQLVVQGRRVASAEGQIEMALTLWDAATGEFLETVFAITLDSSFDFNPMNGLFRLPVFGVDSTGRPAAMSYGDGEIIFEDGSVLQLDVDAPLFEVQHIVWGPGAEQIAVVWGNAYANRIDLVDLETRTTQQRFSTDDQSYVGELGWDATGRYIAVANIRFECCRGPSNLAIYDTTDAATVHIPLDLSLQGGTRLDAPFAWHPSERVLALATATAIEFYEPTSVAPLYTLPREGVINFVWSPSAEQLALLVPGNVIEIIDTPEEALPR